MAIVEATAFFLGGFRHRDLAVQQGLDPVFLVRAVDAEFHRARGQQCTHGGELVGGLRGCRGWSYASVHGLCLLLV